MSVSLGPFITCSITISFLTLYLYIIIYRSNKHYIYGTKAVFTGIAVILLRMCIPVNFPFTYSIYSYKILPEITKPIYTGIKNSQYMVFHIFLLCWLITAVFKLFKLCIEKMRLHRYVKEYIITDPDKYPNIFSSVADCSSTPLNIAVVPYEISPAITGLLRPTLLFPARCETLAQEDLDYICIHEIIHYENHDLWVKLLMEIVSCIHWWNPFIHLLKQEYSLTLELANDYHLIYNYSDFSQVNYAELIVETAKNISCSGQVIPGEVISFARERPTDLSTRINFILKTPSQNRVRYNTVNIHTVIIGIVMVFSLLLVFESSNCPPNSTFISEEGSFELDPEHTYFVRTADGYDIYIDRKFICSIIELPDDFKNYKIYEEGEFQNE